MLGIPGQGLEGLAGASARQELVKIQFGEQDGIAEVVLPGDGGLQLSELTQRHFSTEGDRGGLEENRGWFGMPKIGDTPEAEVFEKFLEQALEIMMVEPCRAVVAGPEIGLTRSGEGDGDPE